jgi:hypothetical protein
MASLGTARAAYGQISPGPLAKAHERLDGTLQCVNCHGVGGKDQMNAQCLQCHKEVAWLIAQRRGFHARQPDQRCASCHPDHAGRDFALIAWPGGDPLRFDHALAGWPLEGRHQTLKCADCHKPAFRVGEAARLSPRKGATPGWVGLERSCTACHEDIHRGALSQNCVTCHDQTHWKPAPGFDHAKTDYPLTGKHADVRCADCHKTASGDSVPVYNPLAHRDCLPCHADPHRGRFTGACRDCHVTRGFRVIDRGKFDHDRTRYPLRGQHAGVTCAQCHDVPGLKTKNPPFAKCTDCHADAHAGTATLAGVVVDCGSCHTVDGFNVAAFTLAQHAKTKYPLEGKHQQVSCVSCHVKTRPGVPALQLGTAGIQMRPRFARCLDCHRDDHGGQLATRADKGECAACHKVAGWSPSTFTVAQHATTRLRLDGRHAEIACGACHGPDRKGLPPLPGTAILGQAGVAFKLKEVECTACHVDPHKGRFAAGGARAKDKGCLACHDTRTFRSSTVDVAAHATFSFVLEGAHRATACVACHPDLKPAAGAERSSLLLAAGAIAELRFEAKRECADCHETPHGDQFAARKDRGRCDACHGVDAFAPAAKFDHTKDATFSTRGAHEHVPCNQCHPVDPKGRSPKALIYRPISGTCASCHGKEPQ